MVEFYDSPIGILKIIADQRKLRGIELVETAEESCPNFVTEQARGQLEE